MSRPLILVIGKSGQVAWELQRSLTLLGEVVALGRPEADLLQPAALLAKIAVLRPAVIVNAAAYTAVDKAEGEEAQAMQINGTAVGDLAAAAQAVGALLVHYSTDYVFDGRQPGAYAEDVRPCPLNAYGRSKLAGEQAMQAVGGDFLILRTTWVYAARGQNFLRSMLRLAQERDSLRIVADQIGAPTWARSIAEATAVMCRQALARRASGQFVSGVYHLTASGETSWHGFASLVVARAQAAWPQRVLTREVLPIPTTAYPLPAQRPLNSRLAGDKLRRDYGLVLPDWTMGVQLCLDELLEDA